MVSFSEKQLSREASGAFLSRAFREVAGPPNMSLTKIQGKQSQNANVASHQKEY